VQENNLNEIYFYYFFVLKEIKKQRGEIQKLGMIKKASKGKHVSRIPFGYKWEKQKLIPAENFMEVEENGWNSKNLLIALIKFYVRDYLPNFLGGFKKRLILKFKKFR
jgi:hypothetical protein